MNLSKSLTKVLRSTYCFAQKSISHSAEMGRRASVVAGALSTPDIPLASVEDRSIVRLEAHDWRKFFSNNLQGLGLEIGPLHRPMVTHSGMEVHYVDRYSVEDLRSHYPELNELSLVEPHILDDAEVLSTVKDGTYDFLIAAHVIEHMKNPLSSLEHWCRVVKPGGLIYMIVPDKRRTFDKQRVRTMVSHIVQDYLKPSPEKDFEHYIDYAMHVHQMKKPNDVLKEAQRLLEIDYSIHFHVFMPEDVLDLLAWFGEHVRPLSVIEGPHMSPGSYEFHFLLQVGKHH